MLIHINNSTMNMRTYLPFAIQPDHKNLKAKRGGGGGGGSLAVISYQDIYWCNKLFYSVKKHHGASFTAELDTIATIQPVFLTLQGVSAGLMPVTDRSGWGEAASSSQKNIWTQVTVQLFVLVSQILSVWVQTRHESGQIPNLKPDPKCRYIQPTSIKSWRRMLKRKYLKLV